VQLFTKPLDGREWLMGQKADPFRWLILLREGETRPCRDRAGERGQKFPSLHASPPHTERLSQNSYVRQPCDAASARPRFAVTPNSVADANAIWLFVAVRLEESF